MPKHGFRTDGHLSRPDVTIRLLQPTRDSKENEPLPAARRQALSLLGLAPVGGCLAAALLRTPVVSYTAVSPLPRLHPIHLPSRQKGVQEGGIFLWPDPAGFPVKDPRPGCYPATRSVECGLSSTPVARSRDHLTGLVTSS